MADSDWQPISQAPAPTTAPTTNAPASGSSESDWQPIATQAPSNIASTPSKPAIGDISGGLAKAFGSAVQTVKSAAAGGIQQFQAGVAQARNPGASPANLPEGILKIGAGALNTVGAIAAPVITPIAKPIVDAASNAISNIPAVQKFAQTPAGNVASRVTEDVGNADTIAGGIAGIAGGADVAPSPEDALSGVKNAAQAANDKVANVISPFKSLSDLKTEATANINKALSNTGKASATGLLNKDSNRLSGIETLYKLTNNQPVTRPDGTTFQFDPTHITNPQDFLSAFVQAKNQIWNKVQAGLQRGSSIKPDYSGVEKTLQDVVDNSASNALKAHAASRLQEIQTLKTQGVDGAQRYLQEELNPRIGSAISGASDAPALKLDAKVANAVNDALDNGLAHVSDASVRPLKDMYASLKSIEPDLVRMVQKSVRAPGGGIPQYINDFANINLLEAAFAHNPAFYLAKAGGMKVLSKVLGTQRDPLDHLSKAFQAVQGYMRNAKPPQESPTLALPPGVRGSPSTVSSGYKIGLPQKAQSTLDALERSNPNIKQPVNNLPQFGKLQLRSPGRNPIRLPTRNK